MGFQLFSLSPTFRVKIGAKSAQNAKIGAKSAQNRRKFLIKMATITTEYGKLSSNKTRTVYLRIRSGKTEKRINTQVKVLESEISPRTKKIKDFSKARQIEMMRLDWETKINQLGIEALGVKVDAQDITSAISKKKEETDFFSKGD